MENNNINFYQGTTNLIKQGGPKQPLEQIKDRISEFFNMKNVHFLFGSGTSCNAIPNMKGLYDAVRKDIYSQNNKNLKIELYSIIKNLKTKNNLEEILGVLYSHRNYLEGKNENNETLETCNELIDKIETLIFNKLNVDFSNTNENIDIVLSTYKNFYSKIALRNKDLSRINIFTTNNDLFNETALDSLNIHYINGFTGGINKFFNPALFNYTFAKRMDTSIEKFEPVENMIYLYKMHGSINWIEDTENKNKFFKTKEIYEPSRDNDKNILIYPTPIKQNKSLGSPYVELFREFQKKLLDPHSVLFIIGYSFSDEHINNIIYQALAVNSTINIVIINDISDTDISKSNDNRIFKIWGEIKKEGTEVTDKIHFFNYIVQNLLPNIDAFKQKDKSIEQFIDFYNENLLK
ncbi:MAG: SIR2 family protein [Bacteroidales bacterium]|jgi:hypothetical protein|nr:SIR2 family protein [Bacteroidales bacterium]